MSQRPLWVALLTSGALGLGLLIACGSESGGNGANGTSSSGGGTSGGQFGSSGSGEGGASSGEGGNPGDCNAPVDMFIIFDRSNSMDDDGNIGTTNSKWTRGVTSLSGYFNSNDARDQGAALQFFPTRNHDDDTMCATGDGYHVQVVPAAAPNFLTLPTNGFDAKLNEEAPGSGLGTPIEAAIRGITRFTEANRRGGRVTIGILITDGDPNGCNNDRPFLSGLLQAHYDKTQIRTYVIGMQGASFDRLEEIARGGNAPEHPDSIEGVTYACGNGTGTCRHWNVGDGDPAAFIAAMKAIQRSADGCQPGGGFINPVN
jgi:hypothetical protein